MGSKKQTKLKKNDLIVNSDSNESDENVEQEEEYSVEKVLDVKIEKVLIYMNKLNNNFYFKFNLEF